MLGIFLLAVLFVFFVVQGTLWSRTVVVFLSISGFRIVIWDVLCDLVSIKWLCGLLSMLPSFLLKNSFPHQEFLKFLWRQVESAGVYQTEGYVLKIRYDQNKMTDLPPVSTESHISTNKQKVDLVGKKVGKSGPDISLPIDSCGPDGVAPEPSR